jgi:hypothetical protein
LNPDPKIDCAGAPVIALAEREWFVPTLAMRQARVVVPGLMRLMPALQALQSGEPSAMAELSPANFDAIVDVVHAALTRAYPHLSREEFLDMPASTTELIAALTTITRQSGFFRPADALGEHIGETAKPATAPRNSSIG